MTPKEKAKELQLKFIGGGLIDKYMGYESAKLCSLIAVDEILAVIENKGHSLNHSQIDYWEQVKTEITEL